MAAVAPRVFRTRPAQVTGVVLVVMALALGVLIGRSEVLAGRSLLGTVTISAVILALSWVVLLRPSVRLADDGVRLHNLLTDVDVPFGALAEVTHRWALEVTDVTGARHSAWAVPVKRRLRPTTLGDSFADATSVRRGSLEGVHAEAVAGQVEKAWQRWKLAGGTPGEEPAARRQLSWAAVAPLLVAALLVVLQVTVG